MTLELWRPGSELRRAPFRELSLLEQEMGEMIGRFFRGWSRGDGESHGWLPALDMLDRKDEVVVRADLPGLDRKDITVSVDGGILMLRGERREEREGKEDDYYASERWTGSFARSITLPPGVDAERIRATFRNGVLEIHLPKAKDALAKKIEIQAA